MNKKKLEFTNEEIRLLIKLIDKVTDMDVSRLIGTHGFDKQIADKIDECMTIKKKLLDYEGKTPILEAKEEK